MSSIKRGRISEIVSELEERALDGERFTIEKIVIEFFEPKSLSDVFVTKLGARNCIQQLKYRITDLNGEWFGCLNADKEYGIPETPGEINYVMNSYKARMFGVGKRLMQAYGKGLEKKLLKPVKEVPLLMPILDEEENNEDKN